MDARHARRGDHMRRAASARRGRLSSVSPRRTYAHRSVAPWRAAGVGEASAAALLSRAQRQRVESRALQRVECRVGKLAGRHGALARR